MADAENELESGHGLLVRCIRVGVELHVLDFVPREVFEASTSRSGRPEVVLGTMYLLTARLYAYN